MMKPLYFILHHLPLLSRKEYLINNFCNKYPNLNIIWKTGYLPSEISLPEGCKFKNIGEYSLYLKHVDCLKIQMYFKIPYIVILEDDCVFSDNVNVENYLEKVNTQFIQSNGDVVFIGSCCNLHASDWGNWDDPNIYISGNFLTRCAHAMGIKLNACEKILKHCDDNLIAWDFKLNDIIQKERLNVYWSEPAILQGSKLHNYESTLGN